MSNQRYMMRGVSAAKEDVHNAIKNIDKGLFPQAFCKIIPDILGGDPEYCNIMHADGAGTKSSLAYMYWKETGDLGVWKGIAQDALIMNTDDLLCVGAVDNILVSSTIGRNKMLIPGEVISAIINGTDELMAEMREMGVGIYGTGGETADVGDLVRTIIVDSTVTCLDLNSVTGSLRERSQALLEERIANTTDLTEIYDENNDYREDVVMEVLYEAAREALAEDAVMVTVELTVNLKYQDGKWWVVADKALLDAISGGVLF